MSDPKQTHFVEQAGAATRDIAEIMGVYWKELRSHGIPGEVAAKLCEGYQAALTKGFHEKGGSDAVGSTKT